MNDLILHTRNSYMERIAPFMEKPLVKVITGMRRTGKSCIVRLLIRDLIAKGVSESQIIYIDKESYEFDSLRDYRDVAEYVKAKRVEGNNRTYVLIDEVQEIKGWERIVSAWSGDASLDVVITGSNARLLSGELATLLAGRYVEIHVLPLSFIEFSQFHNLLGEPEIDVFNLYLKYGGLPGLPALGNLTDVTFRPFVSAVYDSIVLRDIVSRHEIRNHVLLDRTIRYVFDNIGNLTTASRIHTFLKTQRISAGVDTIINYLRWLAEPFLIYSLPIYDIKGKRHLEINEKHYITDLGIRTALLGYRAADIGGLLENLVCIELVRRGYRLSVGRVDGREIDFVAERNGKRLYIQVSYLLQSEETLERETSPLLSVPDNYPKLLLTMDRAMGGDHLGVQRLYLPEWLQAEPATTK